MSSDKCVVCEQPCSSKCSNCRKVSYCSKAHQKEDRKRHRVNCYPAKLQRSELLGRYLVATRDLLEDDLVLKDTPLFSGPNGSSGLHILCLSCYGIITEESWVSCSICKWPLHPQCQQNPLHVENECAVFSKAGYSFTSAMEECIYDKLMVLRGLLLKLQNREKWESLKNLQSHREERLQTERGRASSGSMVKFVHQSCGLKGQFTEEEVDHVFGVMLTNDFATEDDLTSSPAFRSGLYLFPTCSMLAHSCIPNCKWTIQLTGEVEVRALHPINEGEVFYICYAWGGLGTLERQESLKRSKYFVCQCLRCTDPTEKGSFYSAIKCRKCSSQLLPKNPLDSESQWECSESKCTSVLTSLEVRELTELLRNEAASIPSDSDSIQSVVELEEFLKTKLLAKVHPNHFLVHEVEQDILSRLSYLFSKADGDGDILSREDRLKWAERMMELSKNAINLANIIAPGVSTHMGRQLYFQQQGMGLLILDKIKNDSSSPALREIISTWQQIRGRGVQILTRERPGREEYMFVQGMKI